MDLAAQIEQVLTQYQQQGQDLVKLLEQEQVALKENQRDFIGELTQQKQRLLSDFVNADKTLLAIIQQHGNPKTTSIAEIIEQLNTQGKDYLKQLWQNLQTTISTARKLNVTNGIAISNRLNSIKHSLDLLKGQSPNDVVSYNAKGNLQTHRNATGESLA